VPERRLNVVLGRSLSLRAKITILVYAYFFLKVPIHVPYFHYSVFGIRYVSREYNIILFRTETKNK
jgi:hypothetical protein